jgi:hypothetical protein
MLISCFAIPEFASCLLMRKPCPIHKLKPNVYKWNIIYIYIYIWKPLTAIFSSDEFACKHTLFYLYGFSGMSTGLLFVNKSDLFCRLCTVWRDWQASHLFPYHLSPCNFQRLPCSHKDSAFFVSGIFLKVEAL